MLRLIEERLAQIENQRGIVVYRGDHANIYSILERMDNLVYMGFPPKLDDYHIVKYSDVHKYDSFDRYAYVNNLRKNQFSTHQRNCEGTHNLFFKTYRLEPDRIILEDCYYKFNLKECYWDIKGKRSVLEEMDLWPQHLHHLDELELERYREDDMISLGHGPPRTQIMVYPWTFDLDVRSQFSSNLGASAEIEITESYDKFVQRIANAPTVRQLTGVDTNPKTHSLKRTREAAFS